MKIRTSVENMLYALAYKILTRLSGTRKKPYRCCDCGSTDIQLLGWTLPNKGDKYAGPAGGPQECWCNSCQSFVDYRLTDQLPAATLHSEDRKHRFRKLF